VTATKSQKEDHYNDEPCRQWTGISDDFVSEVEALMKPGTSALFVLDQERNMDAILQGIRGLGGTVLRTNVDVKRAKLIQSTLAATSSETEDRP
jgi:uncharacterized membrane protein